MDLLLEEESGMPAMADADEACVYAFSYYWPYYPKAGGSLQRGQG